MRGTNDVLRALVQANPDARVTEDKIRRVLRRGEIASLGRVAGRLVWTPHEILQLAGHLGLSPPVLDDSTRVAASAP